MSTLKKICVFVAYAASLILFGIVVSTRNSTLIQNFISLRILQITAATALFSVICIMVYREPKGVAKDKKTKRHIVVAGMLLFLTVLWATISRPTTPVVVSFEGVAKTTDVIETQHDVHTTNEQVVGVAETLSHFREEQKNTMDSLFYQLLLAQNKVVELDRDNQIRQQEQKNEILHITAEVKKLSVQMQEDSRAATAVLPSSQTIATTKQWIIYSSLFVLVVSLVLSFFPKIVTKISVPWKRWYIPSICVAVIAICFSDRYVESFFSANKEKGTIGTTPPVQQTSTEQKKVDSVGSTIPVIQPPASDSTMTVGEESSDEGDAPVSVTEKTKKHKKSAHFMEVRYTRPPR